MNMDLLTILAGIFSFALFLLIHLIIFRWINPERLLRSLLLCVLIILGLPIILMVIAFSLKLVQAPFIAWGIASVLALLIAGIMTLVYVLCFFGPYETSVRMRLVREIAAGGQAGIAQDDLDNRYNPEIIMNIRLRRLSGSGDIIEKDGQYILGRKANFFFAFDIIANQIKKWIGR